MINCISDIEKNRMENLIEFLNYHTKLYDEGKAQISDAEWDKAYFELKQLEEDTGYIMYDSPTQKVNYIVKSKLDKVEHDHPMLSLDKTKSIEDIKKFIGSELACIMLKMDGLTCSLTYEDGILIKAETRGDGNIGEDILHNALVVKSIPNKIPFKNKLVVDGEIICTYKDFEEFKEEYKNPRNFAAGSIRLLDSAESAKRNLTFVAWDIIEGFDNYNSLTQKLSYLSDWFITVPSFINNSDDYTLEEIIDKLKDRAKDLGYPYDGFVVKYDNIDYYKSLGNTEHHFRGGLALKEYDEEYETELKYIHWSMSKNGTLTPVAVFEPIDIDGSVVERASLHNISIMKDIMGGCCYLGQKIKVIKANMIIPQIVSAKRMAYVDVISAGGVTVDGLCDEYGVLCPCCGSTTTVRTSNSGTEILVCDNDACEGKLVNRIDHFCDRKKGLDVRGLSKATIEKLIEFGWLTCLNDIFSLSTHKSEWEKLPGFGPKSVQNVLSAINSAKSCELWQFISAIGIPLIGSTYAKTLQKVFGSWVNFRKAVNNKEYNFYDIEGFGYEMNKALKNYDYSESDIIAELLNFKEIEETKEDVKEILKGTVWCITGKSSFGSRDAVAAFITSNGGEVKSSATAKVTHLLCNKPENTSKYNNAVKFGIPIVTDEELKGMLDN